MIYKMMNGLCPENLRGRLEISNYTTRNQFDLDSLRQNLEFSKSSFFYSEDMEWNPMGNQKEFHYYHVQKETEGILAKLAFFPKQEP